MWYPKHKALFLSKNLVCLISVSLSQQLAKTENSSQLQQIVVIGMDVKPSRVKVLLWSQFDYFWIRLSAGPGKDSRLATLPLLQNNVRAHVIFGKD